MAKGGRKPDDKGARYARCVTPKQSLASHVIVKATTWASGEPCALKGARTVRRGGQRNTVRLCAPLLPYYTLLTGTVFAKTQQRAATLVLVLRGIAKGEPTARLARELGLSRKQLHTLRQRIQANLNDTAPTGVMTGTAFEADELYQNAGEKKHAASRARGSAPAARQ
jgi:hypothetical protein